MLYTTEQILSQKYTYMVLAGLLTDLLTQIQWLIITLNPVFISFIDLCWGLKVHFNSPYN